MIPLGEFIQYKPETFKDLVKSPKAMAFIEEAGEHPYNFYLEGYCRPIPGWNMILLETAEMGATVTSLVLPRVINKSDFGAKFSYTGKDMMHFVATFPGPFLSDPLATNFEVVPLENLEMIRFNDKDGKPTIVPLLLQGPLNVVPGLIGSELPLDFDKNFKCVLELWQSISPPYCDSAISLHLLESKMPAKSLKEWRVLDRNGLLASDGQSPTLFGKQNVYRIYAKKGERKSFYFPPRRLGEKYYLYSFASF